MNRAMNEVIKKHIILAIFTFIAVVLLASTATYAIFQIDKENTTNQKIAIGNLSANITSIEGAVLLNDLYPTLRSELPEDYKYYEFTVENDGDYDLKYEIYLNDATEAFLTENTGYSSYKKINPDYYKYINFILDDGETQNLASIQNGEKFTLMTGTMQPGYTKTHQIKFFIDKGETTTEGAPNDLSGSILSLDINLNAVAYDAELDNPARETLNVLGLTPNKQEANMPNFANPATTDETANGLYRMQDDYGTSYYFRGAVANNYVKFGGFYWRIIRINGDGSLRMIYDGKQAYANGTSNASRLAVQNIAYNTNYNDAKYVGYMYGPAGTTASTSKEEAQTNTESSNIKTQVETWYKTNIRDKGLDEYVADSIYCNDRTIDTGNGYGTGRTYYGGYARLGSKDASVVQPQFTCKEKNDAFTKSDTTKGNGALSEKVGLITADEVVAAGSGKYNTTNQNYYLYKGNWYWSLSPYSSDSNAYVVYVHRTGNLNNAGVDNAGGVAPVISLTPEYVRTFTGDGSKDNPYRNDNYCSITYESNNETYGTVEIKSQILYPDGNNTVILKNKAILENLSRVKFVSWGYGDNIISTLADLETTFTCNSGNNYNITATFERPSTSG